MTMKFEQINLSHLKYFIDTVELLSFSAAAEKNHVSRPAISQGIKRLEDMLGLQLLIHQKNSLILTKDGEDFYRRGKASFEAFKVHFQDKTGAGNTLKVGCSSSLVDKYLIPPVKQFSKLPKVEIKVGSTLQLKHFLEQDIINVAVFIDGPIIPGHVNQVLAHGSFTVLSPSGKFLPLLVVTEDRPEVTALKDHLYKKGIEPQIIQAESWGLALKLASSLGGACLVPDILMKTTDFKKVRIDDFDIEYKTVLVHKRNEFLSEAELKFCDFLKK